MHNNNGHSIGLTVEEAARELNLSTSTIRRLIKNKKLKAIRLGDKKLRITREEIADYLKRQETI